jgi:endonuclease/exonuclease/phosphatase family metal-dependent hydrolase
MTLSESAPPDAIDHLRVLTLNVLAPAHADWPRRKPVLVEAIATRAPDIVALQEVEVSHVDHLLGRGWHLAAHPGRDPDGVGAILASRWPITGLGHDDLQVSDRSHDFTWTGVVVVRIDVPEPFGTVLVVHHKPVWGYDCEYERERQAVRTTRLVDDIVGGEAAHVILLGDLDAPADSSSIRYLTGRQALEATSVYYRDTWQEVHGDDPGHTFSPDNPLVLVGKMPAELGRRIDYILIRGGSHGPTLRPTTCERVLTDPVDGVQASDHYGLMADLVVPDHPPGEWSLR